MIRFPNPGSDIPTLIRVFRTLYTHLSDKAWFSLDDMSKTLTRMNLAASSGYVGQRALELSTRADRSRDPLYNQSKMYAELFRTLGWMVSDNPQTALRFRFTLLGGHVAAADVNPRAVFEECVLGINYPNKILAVRGTEASRVFWAILRTAKLLGGYICREEVIVGILARRHVGEDDIAATVKYIRSLRGSHSLLKTDLLALSKSEGISITTMENYTRFPLAVLIYCGWFKKERISKFYPGRKKVMFKMTPYGQYRADMIERSVDIRLSHYEKQPAEKQKALIRVGYYTMLQRAEFDISAVLPQIAVDYNVLRDDLGNREVLFSPYQTIRPEAVDSALGHVSGECVEECPEAANLTPSTKETQQQVTTIKLNQSQPKEERVRIDSEIERKIVALLERGLSHKEVANHLFEEYRTATKDEFYPLVADLFTLIGLNCRVSRAGINYERWDAIVEDSAQSIPIEIKSPMEEIHISAKAVRQALENKIILLSRKPYVTDRDTVTLAVGYNPPNDRAEVSRLIQDIKNAFGVRIGVIDFHSLLTIATAAVRSGGDRYIDEIRQMEGIVSVEDV